MLCASVAGGPRRLGTTLRQEGCLGIGEFFVAAVVAAGVDERLGGGEVGGGGFPRIRRLFLHTSAFILHPSEQPGAVKVDVGHEELHRAALGDFPGLVQVALRARGAGPFPCDKPQPGAGEEAEATERVSIRIRIPPTMRSMKWPPIEKGIGGVVLAESSTARPGLRGLSPSHPPAQSQNN